MRRTTIAILGMLLLGVIVIMTGRWLQLSPFLERPSPDSALKPAPATASAPTSNPLALFGPPRYHADIDGVTADGLRMVSSAQAHVSLWISALREPRAGLGDWAVNPALLEERGIVPLKVHLVCSVCREKRSEQPMTYDTDARQSTRATFSVVADRRLADADGSGSLTFLVFSGGQLLDRLITPIQVDSAPAGSLATTQTLLSTIESPMAALPDHQLGPDLIVAVGTNNNRVRVGVTAVSDWAKKSLSDEAKTTFVARELPDGPRFGEVKAPIEHAFDGLKELMEKDPAHRPILSALQVQGPAFLQPTATHMSEGEYQGTISVLARIGTPIYDKLFQSSPEGIELFGWIEQMRPPPGRPLRLQIQASEFQAPWALLRSVESTSVDDFWGLKYELSVVIVDQMSATSPTLSGPATGLTRALYAGLPGDVDSLGSISDGEFAHLKSAMNVTPPLDTRRRKDFLDSVRTNRDALQFIFAFVHGTDGISITPSGASVPSSLGLAMLFRLDDINEVFTPDAFENLRLDLRLRSGTPLVAAHPIVILDACESGATSADRSNADPSGGFPYTFLKEGASAVVATDAPVWGQLARAMGDLLIDRIVAGVLVPKAVYEARRALLKDQHNPLGLLYVSYSLPAASLRGAGGSKS
jgi:hypothetical protein